MLTDEENLPNEDLPWRPLDSAGLEVGSGFYGIHMVGGHVVSLTAFPLSLLC